MYSTRDTELEFEQEMEGEFEDEMEGEFELEGEFEGEDEGEEFLGKLFRRAKRGIGGFVRRAGGVLRRVAKVAAPVVGTAVGGPLGGMLGKAAASIAQESEFEDETAAYEYEAIQQEFEGPEQEFEAAIQEFESPQQEYEDEFESIQQEYETPQQEFEAIQQELETPAGRQQALAELMASVAARAQTEAEAEAMIGAATVALMSPADRAALKDVIPHLVRGSAVLARILRRRGVTRPAVRAIPTIVKQAKQTIARQAASGQPVGRTTAAKAMAAQTKGVLANPRAVSTALTRNVLAARAVRKPVARAAAR